MVSIKQIRKWSTTCQPNKGRKSINTYFNDTCKYIYKNTLIYTKVNKKINFTEPRLTDDIR